MKNISVILYMQRSTRGVDLYDNERMSSGEYTKASIVLIVLYFVFKWLSRKITIHEEKRRQREKKQNEIALIKESQIRDVRFKQEKEFYEGLYSSIEDCDPKIAWEYDLFKKERLYNRVMEVGEEQAGNEREHLYLYKDGTSEEKYKIKWFDSFWKTCSYRGEEYEIFYFENSCDPREFDYNEDEIHHKSDGDYKGTHAILKSSGEKVNGNVRFNPVTLRAFEKIKGFQICSFKDGLTIGPTLGFYESGHLESIMTGNGLWKIWYENGQLRSLQKYQNGEKVGGIKTWYKNGQLSSEETFMEEGNVKLHRFWYENGQLKSELTSIDNKEKIIRWYENGQVKEVGSWRGGMSIGTWNFYDKNGKLVKIKNYDQKVEKKQFYFM